jgi:general stress protein 26
MGVILGSRGPNLPLEYSPGHCGPRCFYAVSSRHETKATLNMTSPTDRAWEIIEKVGVCMLTTRTSKGELRSRPVEARPSRDESCLYVVTDIRSAKEYEIERDPHIGLTFTDQQTNAYLAIAALGAITTNRAQVKHWWRSTDSLWWKGPDDPNVCVLQVELTSGSMWDGPSSKAVELFEFIKAKLTGEMPNLGENRKTDIEV